MGEPSFEEISKAVRFTFSGNSGLAGGLFIPCAKEIVGELAKEGFSEEVGDMEVPDILLGRRSGASDFRASAFMPLFFTISCFVGTGVAGWVVKKLCDVGFEKALKALSKMGQKEALRDTTLNLEVRVFFETDQVLVRIASRCSSPEGYQQVEKLVPVALERAVGFIGRNGVTGPMYTYNIINGQVSNVPTIATEMLGPEHLWRKEDQTPTASRGC